MDILHLFVSGNNEFDFLRGITEIINNKLKVSIFYIYIKNYVVETPLKSLSYRGKIIYEYILGL